jgi:enterochelin esterase family protein
VYLPPCYDAQGQKRYPALYLLHGRGDDESGWSRFGAVEEIADQLIDSGKIAPLIIVMPFGFLKPEDKDKRNYAAPDGFRNYLKGQIAPTIESNYRVSRTPDCRALAGVSMGAEQVLDFAFGASEPGDGWTSYLGCFSPALPRQGFDPESSNVRWKALETDKHTLRLCRFSWGKDEPWHEDYRRVADKFRKHSMDFSIAEELAGGHRWDSPASGRGCLWAKCLEDFLMHLSWESGTISSAAPAPATPLPVAPARTPAA